MRILVSNDDGWYAPGLTALVSALRGHEVTVVAPAADRSGSGTALGRLDDGHAFSIEAVAVDGATAAWALDAPPAMCVLTALSPAIGLRPEVVVSGINAGHNTGRNLACSGTFGAAWMGARCGIPAIAVSAGAPPFGRLDTAARVAELLVTRVASIDPGCVLNVNVPDVDFEAIGPATDAPLAKGGVQRVEIRRDGGSILITEAPPRPSAGDTETVLADRLSMSLVQAGLHVTPIHHSLLDPSAQEATA